MRHSRAPWTLKVGAGSTIEVMSAPGDAEFGNTEPLYVAEVYDDRDATLIAAAPDLLAALREIASLSGNMERDNANKWNREIARAAIAKATGEA